MKTKWNHHRKFKKQRTTIKSSRNRILIIINNFLTFSVIQIEQAITCEKKKTKNCQLIP
jgi:hypothetical protein